MDSLVHADIFFFITTLALIFVTIGMVVVIIYVIKILRDVAEISRRTKEKSIKILDDVSVISSKMKEEGINIVDDIGSLRGDIMRDGFRLGKVIRFFGGRFLKRKKAKQSE